MIIMARGDEILPDLASGCKLVALGTPHIDRLPPEDFSAGLDVEGGRT